MVFSVVYYLFSFMLVSEKFTMIRKNVPKVSKIHTRIKITRIKMFTR
jgi:hypothetical protein